jgi:hypothetical protein
MSASGVDDWEEPPAELDPPEAGWPWQLALCRVFECQQTGYSRSFKIQCTKCGWAPAGFTQAARVQTHFGRVLAGGKPGGANKCGVSKDILLEQEPEFMGKIASALDTSIKRKQTANESRDSVKKKLKASDSASTESGLLPVGWAMKLPAASPDRSTTSTLTSSITWSKRLRLAQPTYQLVGQHSPAHKCLPVMLKQHKKLK